MSLIYRYRRPALTGSQKSQLFDLVRSSVSDGIKDIDTEHCFYIASGHHLTDQDNIILTWLLSETFERNQFSESPFLDEQVNSVLVEVGPRMNFSTSWSTNAVSVCHSCGLRGITRIERSKRYNLIFDKEMSTGEKADIAARFLPLVHDRMTECRYPEKLFTFETGTKPEPVFTIKLIEEGRDALVRINREMGLGLDDWDVDYYYNLFVKDIGRNPTNVECFDLGQSNSEHSRHWFFKGKLIVDGREMSENLMEILGTPLGKNTGNSIIAFKDNSSAINGFEIDTIIPSTPGLPSAFNREKLKYHIIFTAETHNFPTGVAPFPGAETGTGGRLRDVHATGRGSLVIAGTAAYCVGNLNIQGYDLPWEDKSFKYPSNLASPLDIEIEASNGASDYGNKFGEPMIQGYTRSFGLRLPDGERREWIKPIMFTGGVGQIDDRHAEKDEPEAGMLVVKLGGPAYRIGIGGGAASSMIQGENIEELDFSAVQRGDAEMEQKTNKVIRACVEMGDDNPIVSIHDQGAGGNSNVVKEIIYPAGAKIEIRNILVGDNTLSVLEIWGAEFQENDALLVKADKIMLFENLCNREKSPYSVIGEITGDGYIILHDSETGEYPENLELSKVLGKMPQKTFVFETIPPKLQPLSLPADLTVKDALDRVLRLLSVGSKRFLTNKVDRSVTGLIARQQCTGPLQLTLADVAVVAQSHFGTTGSAISIGEQPIKYLISPAAMARMSLGEAITNLVWAKVTSIEDVKFSGNWMWAAKLPGEGAKLYEAAVALRDMLIDLGTAIDGGKDSLSMAALVQENENSEIVKSPGTLVMSGYAGCPDINKVITPDIKRPGRSGLIHIGLGGGRYRLGGSALAHVYNQVGNDSPDVDNPRLLKRAFNVIQELIDKDLVLAGHDVSDGGLITTLLEMAFGGNCGLAVDMNSNDNDMMNILFAEELGFVIEYDSDDIEMVENILSEKNIPYSIIGRTIDEPIISIQIDGGDALYHNMHELRALWEETSYQLERLQANPVCADEENESIYDQKGPMFKLTFSPKITAQTIMNKKDKPKVAIVREEGSNSDREMASSFYQAGFEVWDVAMTDIAEGRVTLDRFRGVAFVGGFSYADVLDSAKGWAGVIRFNQRVYEEFENFYTRDDTFSLGVCNGCQLMALLGWIPWKGIDDTVQPRFIHNKSGRFESRFSTVKILGSPSMMLKGMEGSILGVWVAHGEGRAYFPDESIMKDVLNKNLAPVRFVDEDNEPTEVYPFNPNGSPKGITALCSPDGRHLALMPHPERTFLKWQWAWMPEDWKKGLKASPWLKMFQNARIWCEGK